MAMAGPGNQRVGAVAPDESSGASERPIVGWVVLAAAALGMVGIAYLRQWAPLTGDEPLYALRGRSFSYREVPWFSWPSLRAPGLPLIISPLTRGSDAWLKVIVLVFAVAMVAVVYRIGAEVFSRRSAAWAAIVFAVTPSLLLSSVALLPDVPGACLSLLAILAIVMLLMKRARAWWFLVMVLAVAAANTVRFSSAVVVCIAFVSLLVAMPSIVAAARARVVACSVALAALTVWGNFVPAVGSLDGISPWSANRAMIVDYAIGLDRRPVTFVQSFALSYGFPRQAVPAAIGGLAFLIIVGVAVATGLWTCGRRRDRLILFPLLWFALTLAFDFVNLQTFEIRYLIPILVPIALIAGVGLAAGTATWGRTGATALAVVIGISGLTFGWHLTVDHARADDAEDAAIRDAGQFIAEQDPGCSSELLGGTPGKNQQLLWYSGCRSDPGSAAARYVVVPRLASAPEVPPESAGRRVFRRPFTLERDGSTTMRVLDVYRVP